MKNISLLFIVFISLNSNAKKFHFPKVEYAYAKLYLFNIELDQPNFMDYDIYKNKVYAASKTGNGTLLSVEFHEKLQKALRKGIDELIMGLGKCYMPRHGIIYFDKEDKPVASLSICFECDRIKVWSIKPHHFQENTKRFNYEKAEKQMSDLANIIKEEKIPIYTSIVDVDKYKKTYQVNLKQKKTRPFHINNAENILQELSDSIPFDRVVKWAVGANKVNFQEVDNSTENTNIKTYRYAKKTTFTFENNTLKSAIIYSPKIILPIGVSIGMSILQIYKQYEYTQKKDFFPETITLKKLNRTVKMFFKYETLVKIEIK